MLQHTIGSSFGVLSGPICEHRYSQVSKDQALKVIGAFTLSNGKTINRDVRLSISKYGLDKEVSYENVYTVYRMLFLYRRDGCDLGWYCWCEYWVCLGFYSLLAVNDSSFARVFTPLVNLNY